MCLACDKEAGGASGDSATAFAASCWLRPFARAHTLCQPVAERWPFFPPSPAQGLRSAQAHSFCTNVAEVAFGLQQVGQTYSTAEHEHGHHSHTNRRSIMSRCQLAPSAATLHNMPLMCRPSALCRRIATLRAALLPARAPAPRTQRPLPATSCRTLPAAPRCARSPAARGGRGS